MSEVVALFRSSWLVTTSYRLNFLISFGAILVGIVPLYFIANALQPIAAESIRDEGGQYFTFVLVGMITFRFLQAVIDSIPRNISGGISSGTLEALLNTPARLPMLLVGFVSFPIVWTALSGVLTLAAGAAFGAEIAWSNLGSTLVVLLLIILAYAPIGLMSSASILIFRTPTPLASGVLMISTVLGGVYYSTSVIPSWIGSLSDFVPLTYGLRALRRVTIEGSSLAGVASDLLILALFAAILMTLGAGAFAYAVRYSRRAGTLSHY